MISDQSKGNDRTKTQKLQMHFIKRVDRESPMTLLLAIPELPIASNDQALDTAISRISEYKGPLAISKLKPLSLFISLLLMLKKALNNVKKEKWKVKVVSALQ